MPLWIVKAPRRCYTFPERQMNETLIEISHRVGEVSGAAPSPEAPSRLQLPVLTKAQTVSAWAWPTNVAAGVTASPVFAVVLSLTVLSQLRYRGRRGWETHGALVSYFLPSLSTPPPSESTYTSNTVPQLNFSTWTGCSAPPCSTIPTEIFQRCLWHQGLPITPCKQLKEEREKKKNSRVQRGSIRWDVISCYTTQGALSSGRQTVRNSINMSHRITKICLILRI